MNDRWLECFIAISESESMNQAANKLFISAPALSSMIKRLEEELNVKLFDRFKNKLELNEYGLAFLPYARNAIKSLNEVHNELSRIKNEMIEPVTIYTTASLILQPAITKFSITYPEISISYVFGDVTELSNPSILEKYNFVMTAPEDWKLKEDSNSINLYHDDPAVLLVNKEHPLAKSSSIDLSELKDEKFIALYKGYSSRYFFNQMFELVGFKPKIIIECDYNMRRHAIREGVGISIGTRRTLLCEPDSEIIGIEIKNPAIRRAQSFYWQRNSELSKSAAIFKEFIESFYQ